MNRNIKSGDPIGGSKKIKKRVIVACVSHMTPRMGKRCVCVCELKNVNVAQRTEGGRDSSFILFALIRECDPELLNNSAVSHQIFKTKQSEYLGLIKTRT